VEGSETTISPVLSISTQDVDYVNRPGHLDLVVDRIHQKLEGRRWNFPVSG
jgi:hypothetical protein